jgi:hypothetical protein
VYDTSPKGIEICVAATLRYWSLGEIRPRINQLRMPHVLHLFVVCVGCTVVRGVSDTQWNHSVQMPMLRDCNHVPIVCSFCCPTHTHTHTHTHTQTSIDKCFFLQLEIVFTERSQERHQLTLSQRFIVVNVSVVKQHSECFII